MATRSHAQRRLWQTQERGGGGVQQSQPAEAHNLTGIKRIGPRQQAHGQGVIPVPRGIDHARRESGPGA